MFFHVVLAARVKEVAAEHPQRRFQSFGLFDVQLLPRQREAVFANTKVFIFLLVAVVIVGAPSLFCSDGALCLLRGVVVTIVAAAVRIVVAAAPAPAVVEPSSSFPKESQALRFSPIPPLHLAP